MQLAVLDYLILFSFFLAAFGGFRRGFMGMLLDLVALGLALNVAWIGFPFVGRFLSDLGLSAGLAPLVAFLLILLLIDALVRVLLLPLNLLVGRLLSFGSLGRFVGAVVALGKQVILLSVLTSLLLFLPVLPVVRTTLLRSSLAPRLVVTTPLLERAFTTLITPAITELQTLTTLIRISDEPITLETPVTRLVIDQSGEQELLRLVNTERQERGLIALIWSNQLAEVGRAHSKDMWTRQFFSHVNPDGQTPFDRLKAAGISATVAGENLALAPTIPIAHQGLMNSPGHRANILDPDYRTLGIGAVRNGLYGVMVSQEFTN